MKWGSILVKGSALPLLVLVASTVIAVGFWQVAASSPQYLGAFGRYGDYLVDVGFLAFLALWAQFAWHLWSWEKGSTESCVRCSGPLGRLRTGKVYFGQQLGEYRTCYNCDKHNAALSQ